MNQTVARFDWRKNAVLFGLTVWSVFSTGRIYAISENTAGVAGPWYSGWTFAVPLLLILLAHEFGHYVAARVHRVPASLPYFLPLPVQVGSPFGTLGAIILMPGRIRSARALLDIGAAGPLAGMAVAVPTMVIGLKLSHVGPTHAGQFHAGRSEPSLHGNQKIYVGTHSDDSRCLPASHCIRSMGGFFRHVP